MDDLDKQLAEYERRLDEMKRQRAKSKKPERIKSMRPKGRPRLDAKLIEKSKELAKVRTMREVAFSLNISVSSLYRYGIKRKILNEEKNISSDCDSSAELNHHLRTRAKSNEK